MSTVPTKTFLPFKRPPQPLDEQVIIGRARCKHFLFEHKLGNLARAPLYQLPANMINIQNIYVLNRHRGTPSLMNVNDSRLINNLNRDIEHLIPFWSIINQYCPEPTARNSHAMIFDARYLDGYYIRQPWIDPTPVLNTVDRLIKYSRIYEPIKAHLRELRNIPGLDHEPGPFANDPPDLDNATFVRLLTRSLGRGADSEDEFLHLPAPATPLQRSFPIAKNLRTVTKRSRHRDEEDSN